MPFSAFLLLSGLFLIGTMAFGNYLSFVAVCRFLIKQLGVDQKSERIPFNTWLASEFSS